jgi:hypothetical protein
MNAKTVTAIEVMHRAFGENGVKVADVIPAKPFVDPEDALDQAYRSTNTIDDAWWKNDDVSPSDAVKARGGARSTSVGDVVRLGFSDGTVASWVCANFGWTPVTEGE